MSSSQASSHFLQAYRNFGLVASPDAPPHLYTSSGKHLLSVTAGPTLYQTYDLASLRLISALDQGAKPILKLGQFKDFTILQHARTFSIYRKQKLKGTLQLSRPAAQILDSLVCGKLVLGLTDASELLIWELPASFEFFELKPTASLELGGESFFWLFHPAAYLNKLLLLGAQEALLLNIHSQKVIFRFPELRKRCAAGGFTGVLEQSPIVDVVALAMKGGLVRLWNLKTDTGLLQLKTGAEVLSLSFSQDTAGALKDWSLLATGLASGELVFWDLNGQSKLSAIRLAAPITFAAFVEQTILVTAGNFIGVYIFQKSEIYAPPRLLRSRSGHQLSPERLRFYEGGVDEGLGAATRHVLTLSPTELRDHALLNDAQSSGFSYQRAPPKLPLPTGHFSDFAFSYFRERDWANIATFDSDAVQPILWSAQRHAIALTPVTTKTEEESDDSMTALAVSACGNFGVAGYQSGRIVKFSMQNGSFKNAINCHPVGALALDCANRYLLNASSDGHLICRDFYGGKKVIFSDQPATHDPPSDHISALTRLRICDASGLAAVSDAAGRVFVYDLKTKLLSRVLKPRGSGSKEEAVVDISFLLPAGRVLLVATRAGSLYFWDLLTSRILQKVKFDLPLAGVDVSRSGEFIATVHSGSLAVHMWVNRSRFYPVPPVAAQEVQLALTPNTLPAKAQSKLKQQAKVTKIQTAKLVQPEEQVSGQGSLKWAQLLHLEEIKKRNQGQLPAQPLPEMPFFLFDVDALNKDQWGDGDQEDLFSEFKKPQLYEQEAAPSHFLKSGSQKYSLQLGPLLERRADIKEILNLLEELSPAAIQYEIASLRLHPESQLLLNYALEVVEVATKDCYHLDTAGALLSELLKKFWKEIEPEEAGRVAEAVGEAREELREAVRGVGCLVEGLLAD